MKGEPPTDLPPEAAPYLTAIARAADESGVAILITTPGQGQAPVVRYVNGGAERLFGYRADELRGLNPWALIAPEELDRMTARFAQHSEASASPNIARTTMLHRTGHPIQVELSTTRLRAGDEPIDVSFCVGIGAPTPVEDALRQSERRLRSFIDSAPDGIIMLDWPQILFVNEAAAPMLGFADRRHAAGADIRKRLQPAPVGGDARVELQDLLRRPREVAQFQRQREDGTTVFVELSSIPTEFEGQPAVLAFARDVTERNAIMASMVEADKLAAVGTIAAGVAHEINNPLAYVMLNLEFLSRDLPRIAGDPSLLPHIEQRLVDIRQGTERVKTIVRDLQAFTRREEEIRGPIDLESVIDNAMHLARHEIRHHARLVRSFQMVPPVHGNATRLEQLFLNLLVNAAHALLDGDPAHETIEVAMHHTRDWVVVEVRDTGCGMSEEDRKRAFEAFYTTKPQGVGTGLGLAICQGIVHQLGGEIEIDSALGEGTTVRVLLRPEVAVKRHSTAPPPEPPPEPTRGRRGRILLVDDEVSVAESLGYAIRDDHDVDIATSAASARELIELHGADFDVILCDLVMPGESGMDLYAQVQKAHPALCSRFIFMSGGAFFAKAEEFLRRVDNPHIDKPFDLQQLAHLIAAQVARQHGT